MSTVFLSPIRLHFSSSMATNIHCIRWNHVHRVSLISNYVVQSQRLTTRRTTRGDAKPSQSRLAASSTASKQFHVWEQTISSANAHNASSSTSGSSTTSATTVGKHEAMQYRHGRKLYRPATAINDRAKHTIGWEEVAYNAVVVSSSSEKIDSTKSAFASLSWASWNSPHTIPFLHHFLPAKYPKSVCSSYSSYATYCFLGSIAGSAGMVLSTQALLVAVGVGTQSAAPMAAALNWVMKDGVGQLGGVLFASQLGSGGMDMEYWRIKFRRKQQSSPPKKIRRGGNFQQGTADSNPKRWRMVAALALDLSTLLEICTPMMGPEWFLPCASVANIGKNVGFLAASASRAAIHQSLSMGGSTTPAAASVVDDTSVVHSLPADPPKKMVASAATSSSNLGDVTAKAGSQSIMASLLGTALGIFLSQTFCPNHGTVGILAGFVVLSAVHQVCTYQAVKVVPIRSLDRHRLHIVLTSYISDNKELFSGISNESNGNGVNDGKLMQTLTPEQVAEKESFLPMMPPDDSVRWLSIGDSLMNVCPSGVAELEALLLPSKPAGDKSSKENIDSDFTFNAKDFEKYILKVTPLSNANSEDGLVQLTFLEGATEYDILRGMFHSYAAHAMMMSHPGHDILQESHSKMASEMPVFIDNLQEGGWQIGPGFVNVECGSSHRLTIGNA